MKASYADVRIVRYNYIFNYSVSNYIKICKIDEKQYFIGNSKLMKEQNIDFSKQLKDEEELERDGNSILFVAEENIIIALIGVKDTIRENLVDVINKLKQQGKEVVMLTGDNEKTAKSIADDIGITNVIANVLPKEKAEKIKELKKNGLVMMCGDGINDSVSLVTADVGVAVGNGTDIAMDSSDVVLMKDNLKKIPELMNISRRTIRNIKQNLFWAFFYNICMLPISMGVFTGIGLTMNPMFASLAMTLSSITVTLNSLRLRR